MRKTFIMALIALMVMLALVSCDNFPIPGGEKPDDGLVAVKVKVDEAGANSRSLTEALAQSQWNYMEVIFKKGSNYYQAEGYKTSGVSIRIPVGDYSDSGNGAIILLGHKNGVNTLFATGRLATGDEEVDATTVELTFTVTALTASLVADTNATVVITGAAKGGTPPSFQVNIGTSNIDATVTISGFADTGADIKVTNRSVAFQETTSTNSTVSVASTDITSPTIGNAIASANDAQVKFKFTAPNVESAFRITFPVTVKGYGDLSTIADNLPNSNIEWVIRGGYLSGADILGNGNDAILLTVVDPEEYAEIGNINVPGYTD